MRGFNLIDGTKEGFQVSEKETVQSGTDHLELEEADRRLTVGQSLSRECQPLEKTSNIGEFLVSCQILIDG